MYEINPIYTEVARCQDCYKCLRGCPVKAIRIENGRARVMPERCILCGRCVEICPVEAKKVRNEVVRVLELMRRKGRVILSLAPSWQCAFPGLTDADMIAHMKALGFSDVSETALGAEEVSGHVRVGIDKGDIGLCISSACPVSTDYIRRYHPELSASVTPLLSPLLAHCTILRHTFGKEIGIVFAGPCIGKKAEADRHPELLDAALTFRELAAWMGQSTQPVVYEADAVFVPRAAHEGRRYPVDGGMISTIRSDAPLCDGTFAAVSGIEAMEQALEGLAETARNRPLFLELLACEGSCVNGPGMPSRGSIVRRRMDVLDTAPAQNSHPQVCFDIQETYAPDPVAPMSHSDEALMISLRRVGKYRRSDELNCGGCGYNSCREFAAALLSGTAETAMCVSYMRQLAHNKAASLLAAMPVGAVIVDRSCTILESNRNFARIIGGEALVLFDACPGLAGVNIEGLVPFASLFRHVLTTGEQIRDRDVRHGGAVYRLSIFTVEAGDVVGAILADVTEPVVQKEIVVERARTVIRRNLETVQQIAFLLGENAAESEIVLNTIIDSFGAAREVEHDRAR